MQFYRFLKDLKNTLQNLASAKNLNISNKFTYFNGNDGTNFDWDMNRCTCELGFCNSQNYDDDVWARVYQDGRVFICYHKDGQGYEFKEHGLSLLDYSNSLDIWIIAREFKNFMLDNYDNCQKFDEEILC